MATEGKIELREFNGIQRKTSQFEGRDGDLWMSINAEYDEIGSVSKSLGYEQRGNQLTSTTSTSTSSSTTTTTTSTSSSTSSSTSTTTT